MALPDLVNPAMCRQKEADPAVVQGPGDETPVATYGCLGPRGRSVRGEGSRLTRSY